MVYQHTEAYAVNASLEFVEQIIKNNPHLLNTPRIISIWPWSLNLEDWGRGNVNISYYQHERVIRFIKKKD